MPLFGAQVQHLRVLLPVMTRGYYELHGPSPLTSYPRPPQSLVKLYVQSQDHSISLSPVLPVPVE